MALRLQEWMQSSMLLVGSLSKWVVSGRLLRSYYYLQFAISGIWKDCYCQNMIKIIAHIICCAGKFVLLFLLFMIILSHST